MGGGGGQQSASSSVQETTLSLAQADILKQREAQYQQYFFPELLNSLEEAKGDNMTTSLMSGQAAGINQQTEAAKRQFSNAAAQRGIAGTGVELQGLSSINNAKNSMLADAYYQSKQAQINQKMALLQMGMGMSPQPTQAAPIGTASSSSGSDLNGKLW